MFCSNCGMTIDDESQPCPTCGAKIKTAITHTENTAVPDESTAPTVDDPSSYTDNANSSADNFSPYTESSAPYAGERGFYQDQNSQPNYNNPPFIQPIVQKARLNGWRLALVIIMSILLFISVAFNIIFISALAVTYETFTTSSSVSDFIENFDGDYSNSFNFAFGDGFKNEGGSGTTAPVTPDANVVPDGIIKAADIINEYIFDAIASDQKYIDKNLTINGKVVNVGTYEDGNAYVTIAGDVPTDGPVIECEVTKEAYDMIANTYLEGDTIVLSGKQDGTTFDIIYLSDCTVQ